MKKSHLLGAVCALMSIITPGMATAGTIYIDSFFTPFDVSGEAGWNGTNGAAVGNRSNVFTLTQTSPTGAIGDRTASFTGQAGDGLVISNNGGNGITLDSSGAVVAPAPNNGILTLNTNAGNSSYSMDIAYAVTNLDLSLGDRFSFNLNGDLDAPRDPVASLPFDIKLTSGANMFTAGATLSADGSYEILFSAFTGIDFSDIDGIKLLSTNGGVPSPDLAISAITVQTVPIPAAVWLFGSGLLGLVGVARRKKA